VFNTTFTRDSWKLALEDEREEKSHWVWIELKALGFDQNFAEQGVTAKKEDKKAYPERYSTTATNSDMEIDSENKPEASEPKQIVNMADVNDLALGMLMAKALFNEIPFSWDPDTYKGMVICTKTITIDVFGNKWPIVVSVVPTGLYVSANFGNAHMPVGFVCARRSFEVETFSN
jgi:hypothetical protein